MNGSSIDFLPVRYVERRALQQTRIWGLSILVLFGSLVGLAFAGQTALRLGIHRQLDEASGTYNDTQIAQQALDAARKQVETVREDADLFAYLSHPWPRTQILARLAHDVPAAVTIDKIHVGLEIPQALPGRLTPGVIKPTEPAPANGAAPPPPAPLSPAKQDLKRLRDERESRRTIVELSGTTTSIPDLHGYLNRLANDRIFALAELTSIETLGKHDEGRSQFTARLVVRPSYGQPGGPTGPTTAPSTPPATTQADATRGKTGGEG